MPLLALSAAYFVSGTASLSVVGMLGPMAADLGASAEAAALLVALFALAFALAPPLVPMLLGGRPARRILAGGLLLVALSCLGTALAGGQAAALAARVLGGVGAAMVGPVASSMAAAMAPPERRGRALGLVFGSVTVATVLGVPLAAWGAAHLSWRVVLLAIALLGAAMAALVPLLLPPAADAALGRGSLGALAAAIRLPAIGLRVAATGMQMAAQFVTYALVAHLLVERFAAGPGRVPPALFVFGAAGVAGNAVAGRLADRFGAQAITRLSHAGLLCAFAALALAPPLYGAALAVLAAWAAAGIMLQAPQQKALAAAAGPATGVALGLNAAALYLGTAAGSALGGLSSHALGLGSLAPMSLVLALAAAALSEAAARRRPGVVRPEVEAAR